MNKFSESIHKNIDWLVKACAIIGFLLIALTIIIQLNTNIEEEINEKISDPNFVKKVTNELLLSPFLIFNSEGTIVDPIVKTVFCPN